MSCQLYVMRHGQTNYNEAMGAKNRDPNYLEFRTAYEQDFQSKKTKQLAKILNDKYKQQIKDSDIRLTEKGKTQSIKTGIALQRILVKPDIVLCSPMYRAKETYKYLAQQWPELLSADYIEDQRLREQAIGNWAGYPDVQTYFVTHPEQKIMFEQLGYFNYCPPQGENMPTVMDRVCSLLTDVHLKWSDKKIFMISHRMVVIAFRCLIDTHSSSEELFYRLDQNKKLIPQNTSVTLYRSASGKLKLMHDDEYNKKLY